MFWLLLHGQNSGKTGWEGGMETEGSCPLLYICMRGGCDVILI